MCATLTQTERSRKVRTGESGASCYLGDVDSFGESWIIIGCWTRKWMLYIHECLCLWECVGSLLLCRGSLSYALNLLVFFELSINLFNALAARTIFHHDHQKSTFFTYFFSSHVCPVLFMIVYTASPTKKKI